MKCSANGLAWLVLGLSLSGARSEVKGHVIREQNIGLNGTNYHPKQLTTVMCYSVLQNKHLD